MLKGKSTIYSKVLLESPLKQEFRKRSQGITINTSRTGQGRLRTSATAASKIIWRRRKRRESKNKKVFYKMRFSITTSGCFLISCQWGRWPTTIQRHNLRLHFHRSEESHKNVDQASLSEGMYSVWIIGPVKLMIKPTLRLACLATRRIHMGGKTSHSHTWE